MDVGIMVFMTPAEFAEALEFGQSNGAQVVFDYYQDGAWRSRVFAPGPGFLDKVVQTIEGPDFFRSNSNFYFLIGEPTTEPRAMPDARKFFSRYGGFCDETVYLSRFDTRTVYEDVISFARKMKRRLAKVSKAGMKTSLIAPENEKAPSAGRVSTMYHYTGGVSQLAEKGWRLRDKGALRVAFEIPG